MAELLGLERSRRGADRGPYAGGRQVARADRRPRRDHRRPAAATWSPATPATWPTRSDDPAQRRSDGRRRADMMDIRSTFHQELDEIQTDIVRLAAHGHRVHRRGAPRCCCRATCTRAQQLIDADDELDALVDRHRGALLPGARPPDSRWPATCGPSSPPSGSPRRSSAPATSWSTSPRARAASTGSSSTPGCAASCRADGRGGAAAHPAGDRRLRRARRRQGGRARRHGRPPRRAAQGLHPGDLRDATAPATSTCRPACSSR